MAAPTDKSPKNKFQQLYDSKRTPGSWKDKYRKRCFENLRKNRGNLLARFRHVASDSKEMDSSVRSIMQQEWRMLQYEDGDLPSVEMDDDGFKLMNSSNEEVEAMLSLFEDIQKELKEQEQSLLREYEASLHHEEARVSAEAEHHSSHEVICPVCQRS